MVDLHERAGVISADEPDALTAVGISEGPAGHHAIPSSAFVHDRGQIPGEDVVASVAAVLVHIGPGRSELGAVVTSLGGSTLDGHGVQCFQGGAGFGASASPGGHFGAGAEGE